jgi:hypothetical protein
VQEAPVLCVIPLCATALGTMALFFCAPFFKNLLDLMVLR